MRVPQLKLYSKFVGPIFFSYQQHYAFNLDEQEYQF